MQRQVRVSPLLVELASFGIEQVLGKLQSAEIGITDQDAQTRLREQGFNALAHDAPVNILVELAKRLANPLNILLITLAIVSIAVLGDRKAGGIILVMVALSVSLAYLQERRSNKAAQALRAMVHTTATVERRPGGAREIPIHLLVAGDIVHLSAGDMVPADVRLLKAKDLSVNQSALTGESMPVEKHADAFQARDTESLQLPNVCFMGTNIVSGSAIGVIALTGERTYFGGLSQAIVGDREITSFDIGIDRFSGLMLRFILVMAPLVFLINGLTKGNWLEALLFAVAVAVGLTPEMLPMIVTVNLGKGALDMSRKKVIVKRLNAIQNLGAMNILCTDKTGTLTQDRVILQRHVDLDGNESQRVLQYAFLNSFYQTGLKNLLDVAVLNHADSHSLTEVAHRYRKIDELPFDFSRRRMSVVVDGDNERVLICKGAVEEVFSVSRHGEIGTQRFDLDRTHETQLHEVTTSLQQDGFRVVAIAYKPIPKEQAVCTHTDEADLILLGYIAFLDPPKESAGTAIAALRAHGVDVKILTGDNDIVTRKVCRDVGVLVEHVIIGSELASLSEVAFGEAAERGQVFARLSPTQKSDIIATLRKRGHVVGFLGDGINDGPALKAADVGISVDTAVDIAKESADIILLEKSLMVLDDGVLEGRKVFGNIVKYIRMGASSSFGNMFSVIGASAWLPFLPMAPIQVLTNNLLYDFSQTAIPTDNVDEEYLVKPRRWEIGNIARFMLFIGPISSIFDYATYGLMYFWFLANTPAHASLFQTGWFIESLLSQTLIIHIIRTRKIPFFKSRASLPLIFTSVTVCALGLWLPYSPLANALGLTALPAQYWPILTAMLATYLVLTYFIKRWIHRRFGLD